MGACVPLIDDNHATLEMMRLVEESEGYHVKTSLTAFEDVKEVENLHPDVIIVDFKIRERETIWTFLQKLKLTLPNPLLKETTNAESLTYVSGPLLHYPQEAEQKNCAALIYSAAMSPLS